MTTNYLKIGYARELTGSDRRLFRALEMLPGFLSWGTLIGLVIASWKAPIWAAVFIIIFDVYWLMKTVYLSLHLRSSFSHMQEHMRMDWGRRLETVKSDHLWQLVLLPYYHESHDVVRAAVEAIRVAEWPNERLIIVLAREERVGAGAKEIADKIVAEYGNVFAHLIVTEHPEDIVGELKGKGSNIAYAARYVKEHLLDAEGIAYTDVIVSAFDIDTVPYPEYFRCLAWHFLTAEKPHRSSYQPIPLYNNNIWHAPAISRVVALSGTFWQMMQQVRPERLSTFSSHSMSFQGLVDVGYWQTNMVSEDSRIFWNSLLTFNGDYRVIPLFYPVSMDANLAPTLWETAKNVYKQQRRWTWGVENVPYLLFGFIKNKNVSARTKFHFAAMQLEGFWSLATNPLLIFALGWLPLMLGSVAFNATLLAFNLPRITRLLMTLAMAGLVGSAALTVTLLPPKPLGMRNHKWAFMILQWFLVPVTIIVFGAIPGLESQTRLMFGKYMGFWVTPKHRSTMQNVE